MAIKPATSFRFDHFTRQLLKRLAKHLDCSQAKAVKFALKVLAAKEGVD